MADVVLVDTDVLIELARGVGDALECVERLEERARVAISAVSEMEMIVGCRNKAELRALNAFLKRFRRVGLSKRISERAADLLREYRLSHGLLIPDALIAATALSLEVPCVTRNQRDFRFVAGLRLLSYPQPFAPAL